VRSGNLILPELAGFCQCIIWQRQGFTIFGKCHCLHQAAPLPARPDRQTRAVLAQADILAKQQVLQLKQSQAILSSQDLITLQQSQAYAWSQA
jgi:hypothetical protein